MKSTKAPNAGHLIRAWGEFKRHWLRYTTIVALSVGGTELVHYLAGGPDNRTEPAVATKDGDIVSRLGLENEVEYVALQLDGRLKRVKYDGTAMDPNFSGYVPLQPETILITLERQEDGSYMSTNITEGGTGVGRLDATYMPGQPLRPGTPDQITLEGLTHLHLPAPSTSHR